MAAGNWIAANTDAGALAKASIGSLLHRFISQGAGARHDADLAGQVDITGHDANFAFTGSNNAGAIRTNHACATFL